MLVGVPALWLAACAALPTLLTHSVGVIIAVPGAASLVVLAARRVYLPLVIVLAALTAGLTLGYLLLVFVLFEAGSLA